MDTNRILRPIVASCLLICLQSICYGQKHQLITGHEAPGSAAQKMLLGQPDLALYSQPVEILVPRQCQIGIGMQGGFSQKFSGRMQANLRIGPVYRLEVDNLPFILGVRQGVSVYPSIELLDRLYPPEGLKDQFPIQIVLTADDLAEAAKGKLVTKVVYLEDPKTALPVRQVEGTQSTVDIAAGADPYLAAERMGRPMAIVRIGSRVPNPSDLTGEFQFNAPSPEVLTAPIGSQAGTNVRLNDQRADRQGMMPLRRFPKGQAPRSLPPIVRPTPLRQSGHQNIRR